MIQLAADWATASLPSDIFGENGRVKVLRAITVELAALIGGQRWAHVEKRIADYATSVEMSEMQTGVGEQRYQRELARELARWIDRLRPAQPGERVQYLADALTKHARNAGVQGEAGDLAEFLLRLASEPGSLATWPDEDLRVHLKFTLDSPVLLRAARFMVAAIDEFEVPGAAATYGGWAWE